MSDDRDRDGAPPSADGDASAFVPRQHAFSLLAIAILAVWKVYEAIVADTMRAAISPSLYLMGLAGFAVSILGPRVLQAVTFLLGAALCIAAISLELR
jgi:hypothetical protein